MKKLLSMIIAIIFISNIVFGVPICVEAVYKECKLNKLSTDGKYYYRVLGENIAEFSSPGPESFDDWKIYDIPYEIDGYTIISIGSGAFSDTDSVDPRHIVIPDTVTYIKDNAFSPYSFDDGGYQYYTTSLKNVEIPSSVTYIGKYAFSNCKYLETIKLPKKLMYLGEGAFYNCRELKEITVPRTITNIPQKTFFNCANLNEVTIEHGVESIGKKAFLGCESLKKLTASDCLRYVDENSGLGYYTVNGKNQKVKGFKIYVKEYCENFWISDLIDYADENKIRINYIFNSALKGKLWSYNTGLTVNFKVAESRVTNWKSSNPKVATIDSNGKFTMLKKGVTTITATLKDGNLYSKKVEVKYNPTLSTKKLVLKKGEIKKVTISSKADGVNNVYKSTKKAKIIGSVKKDYFKVRALKKGETTLRVTVNGKILKLKVKVK